MISNYRFVVYLVGCLVGWLAATFIMRSRFFCFRTMFENWARASQKVGIDFVAPLADLLGKVIHSGCPNRYGPSDNG
jgi:hypothetical protein